MKHTLKRLLYVYVVIVLLILSLTVFMDTRIGHASANYLRLMFFNDLFFAELVSLFCLCVLTIFVGKLRKHAKAWGLAAAVMLLFVVASYANFKAPYYFATEADGRRSAIYECNLGELYQTHENDSDNNFICFVRNIPLENSDLFMLAHLGTFDPYYINSPQLVESFLLSQIVLFGSLIAGYRLRSSRPYFFLRRSQTLGPK